MISVEIEGCYSALKSLKTKFRGTMTEGSLTSLCMLKIHHINTLEIKATMASSHSMHDAYVGYENALYRTGEVLVSLSMSILD